MARTLKSKELINTRLANTYGGWIYCEGCNKTIGYLCYVTYNRFEMLYKCKCGNDGSAHLVFDDEDTSENAEQKMTTIKNRLCCPADESPLVTILSKKLLSYECDIVCKACNTKYREEQNV